MWKTGIVFLLLFLSFLQHPYSVSVGGSRLASVPPCNLRDHAENFGCKQTLGLWNVSGVGDVRADHDVCACFLSRARRNLLHVGTPPLLSVDTLYSSHIHPHVWMFSAVCVCVCKKTCNTSVISFSPSVCTRGICSVTWGACCSRNN